MKMKQFGLTETKLFHFHRIFKNGGGEWGSSEPFEPPLDPPLYYYYYDYYFYYHTLNICYLPAASAPMHTIKMTTILYRISILAN